eukprot:356968-Chlamydomonas_euryale.AAC.3
MSVASNRGYPASSRFACCCPSHLAAMALAARSGRCAHSFASTGPCTKGLVPLAAPRPSSATIMSSRSEASSSCAYGHGAISSQLRGAGAPARQLACYGFDPKGGKGGGGGSALQFNSAYAAIFGIFAALFLLRNPYVFAGITILVIIPQNSAVTSLNSLVNILYDSGLFMNFAEAVYCVRLISWLSIACTLISFAVFA